jgi:Tfp pilus assembly PilM family ATPase
MPGLTDELVKVLGVEIQIANPLFAVETEGAKKVIGDEENLSRFSVSLGLAKLSLV